MKANTAILLQGFRNINAMKKTQIARDTLAKIWKTLRNTMNNGRKIVLQAVKEEA